MRRLMLIPAVLSSAVLASQSPVREVSSQAVTIGGEMVPSFDKGYLIQLSTNLRSQIKVYKPDGSLAFDTVVQLPQGESPSLMSAAVDTDGTVAVSEFHRESGLMFHEGIAILDPAGIRKSYFDTGPYVPENLCWGPDHSLWIFGWERTPGNGEVRTDYMMLRKYSTDGKELAAYFRRSLYPKGLTPGGGTIGMTRIYMSQNRVGLVAFSGQTSANPEWVELDFNGNLLGRWHLADKSFSILAFTANGDLYGQLGGNPPLMRFDHASGSWKPISQPTVSTLLGADGNDLVFNLSHGQGPMQIAWFPAPSN